jgi:membrane-bound metal-dependent hydrolase YbcI (DUF457 family)
MLIPTNMSDIELDFLLCGSVIIGVLQRLYVKPLHRGYGHTLIVLSFWQFFCLIILLFYFF